MLQFIFTPSVPRSPSSQTKDKDRTCILCGSGRAKDIVIGLPVRDNDQEVLVGAVPHGTKHASHGKGNGLTSSCSATHIADVADNLEDILFDIIVIEIEFYALIIGELYSSDFGTNVGYFKHFDYVGSKLELELEITLSHTARAVN